MAVDWGETVPINSDNLNDDSVKNAYPVGSIYMNANTDENPENLIGFGTWERFGKGRVLVGVDESDSDFNNPEDTGGSKTHTLTESEMPSHDHNGSTSSAGNHNHRLYGSDGSDSDNRALSEGNSVLGDFYGNNYYSSGDESNFVENSGSHTHSLNINNTGGGNSHNNLQPYITVYMWIRTA